MMRAVRRAWSALALNGFWVPLHFQDTALPAIAIPAAVVALAPRDHVRALAVILALMSLMAMIVPPIAGAISDAARRRGIGRRTLIWLGAALDIGCLVTLANVHGYWTFVLFLLLATAGANISLAAYQAMIPDVVPQASWGVESGIRNIATLAGVILGFAVAAATPVPTTFIAVAIAAGVGAALLVAQPDRALEQAREAPAHISDWHDFSVVFIARLFLAFGLALLMTFVLYFFRDILHAGNPSAGTAFVGFASLGGAIASGVYLGWLSDRVPRKIIVAACGIPMTLAAAGFAAFPDERAMYGFAVLFGVGFGGIMSTGWALAIDSVPKLHDAARDLGIWGIAQNFPQVVAPIAGSALLAWFGYSETGYRVLFSAAAVCFAAGSAVVLAVGARPVIPIWGAPMRVASGICVWTYTHLQNRIRRWGALPANCSSSLVIANHQIEVDLMEPMAVFVLTAGTRAPMLTASARLMYEPGFMAVRVPWLRGVLRDVNLGWLFEGLGLLPIENELQTRSIARWAWSIERAHGALPLASVFKAPLVERYGLQGVSTADLFAADWFDRAQTMHARMSDLLPAFRKEAFDTMRLGVEEDLARIASALRRGASFFVTPEGEYPPDGKMLPFRGIWEYLEPHATRVFLCAIAYDPFRGRRLSELYRIVELRERADVRDALKRARPVTTSALLAQWLLESAPPSFRSDDAVRAVSSRASALRTQAFVDPELLRNPEACVVEALFGLLHLKIAAEHADGYRLTGHRRHPRFPDTADILEHQKNFLDETLGATQGPSKSGRMTG